MPRKKAAVTLKDIARDYNLSYETFRSRIELGWTVHDAVYVPIGTSRFNLKKFKLGDKLYTVRGARIFIIFCFISVFH